MVSASTVCAALVCSGQVGRTVRFYLHPDHLTALGSQELAGRLPQ